MKTTSEAGLPPVPGGEVLVTKKQLARLIGKSERTIDYWRKRLGLPCYKVEHSVLFRPSDVLQHLEKTNGQSGTLTGSRRLLIKPELAGGSATT